jgi:hypothetical protein
MREVIAAVRQAIPDASSKLPAAVLDPSPVHSNAPARWQTDMATLTRAWDEAAHDPDTRGWHAQEVGCAQNRKSTIRPCC